MEESKSSPIPEILTLVDKEKYRRKLLLWSRLIAIGLVLSIVWFGWVNYKYAKEINGILSEYGSNGFCYLCGRDALKKCECQYNPTVSYTTNISAMSENLAYYNSLPCNDKDLAGYTNSISMQPNLSFGNTSNS